MNIFDDDRLRRLAYMASTRFTRRRPDGSVAEWQQEDEEAAKTKAEAIAMVQRTLDFWIPKIADDLQDKRNLPREEALKMAKKAGRDTLSGMLQQPFPKKWGMVEADFTLDVPD